MLDQITQVLATTTSGTFATRWVCSAKDLQLDVKDVGTIALPISSTTARRLHEVGRPALYGLRDQTLLDKRVRDGHVIAKDAFRIDARCWRRTMDEQLVDIARDLGLPPTCSLRAELHDLLVYGPGQFFATHQDSEKSDGMIGSLVVVLPSKSKGGALVIRHHDENVAYRGSDEHLAFIAFYADCQHEVRPVTSGYRVALTYNLFVEGTTSVSNFGRPLDRLARLVEQYFAAPQRRGPPDRLVYLLDHEYTQSGLSWDRLKNGDASRAALLRDVAVRLDCEVVLALADVHETWSCEDDWYGHRRGSWGHADEDDRDGGEHALVELCSTDVELRHWLAPSGKGLEPISSEVDDGEICFTKASVELEPFASEHEGYTGNAGNTVDRWYHRAAVMLWPRARTFAIRAKASPAWAMRELAKLVERGNVAEARTRIGELRSFWNRTHGDAKVTFVDQTLRVAAAIDDVELAEVLLEPLALEQLTPPSAPSLAGLFTRYGAAWVGAVFDRWTQRERFDDSRHPWLAALPELTRALGIRELSRRLVRAQWTWLDTRIRVLSKLPSIAGTRALIELADAIAGVIAAAEIAGDRDMQDTIVEAMTQPAFPVDAAIAVLRVTRQDLQSVRDLCAACVARLEQLASDQPRGKEDWSITTDLRCTCDLCKQLARFLRSRDRALEWPLAKHSRSHVHRQLDHHELPVTHETRRTGSPHVLVLTKTTTLFTRETSTRRTRTNDLAWLRKR